MTPSILEECPAARLKLWLILSVTPPIEPDPRRASTDIFIDRIAPPIKSLRVTPKIDLPKTELPIEEFLALFERLLSDDEAVAEAAKTKLINLGLMLRNNREKLLGRNHAN